MGTLRCRRCGEDVPDREVAAHRCPSPEEVVATSATAAILRRR